MYPEIVRFIKRSTGWRQVDQTIDQFVLLIVGQWVVRG